MISRWCALPIITVVLAALLVVWAQTSPPHGPAKDYSQEAAVIEEMSTRIAFGNDGNFTREQNS